MLVILYQVDSHISIVAELARFGITASFVMLLGVLEELGSYQCQPQLPLRVVTRRSLLAISSPMEMRLRCIRVLKSDSKRSRWHMFSISVPPDGRLIGLRLGPNPESKCNSTLTISFAP